MSSSFFARRIKAANCFRALAGLTTKLFTMSITLDSTVSEKQGEPVKPVSEYTKMLFELLQVDKKLPSTDQGRNKARPPWVVFHWGDLHSFKAVVSG